MDNKAIPVAYRRSPSPAREPCCVPVHLASETSASCPGNRPCGPRAISFRGEKNPNEQNRMKAEARALLVPCSPLLATTPPARKPLPRSRPAFPRLGPADLGCPELLWMDALPPKLGASGCQGCLLLRVRTSRQHTHMHMAFTRRLS